MKTIKRKYILAEIQNTKENPFLSSFARSILPFIEYYADTNNTNDLDFCKKQISYLHDPLEREALEKCLSPEMDKIPTHIKEEILKPMLGNCTSCKGWGKIITERSLDKSEGYTYNKCRKCSEGYVPFSQEIMTLAEEIYTTQRYDDKVLELSSLVDYNSPALKNHLQKSGGTHFRGCWAIDYILGKHIW